MRVEAVADKREPVSRGSRLSIYVECGIANRERDHKMMLFYHAFYKILVDKLGALSEENPSKVWWVGV